MISPTYESELGLQRTVEIEATTLWTDSGSQAPLEDGVMWPNGTSACAHSSREKHVPDAPQTLLA